MKINYRDVLEITNDICNDWKTISKSFNRIDYFKSKKIVEREWSSAFMKKIISKNNEYVTNSEMQVLFDKNNFREYLNNDQSLIGECNYLDGVLLESKNANNINIFEFKYQSIKHNNRICALHYDVARSLLFMHHNENVVATHFLNTALWGSGKNINVYFVNENGDNNLVQRMSQINYEQINNGNSKSINFFFDRQNMSATDFFENVIMKTKEWIEELERLYNCNEALKDFSLYYFVIENENLNGRGLSNLEKATSLVIEEEKIYNALRNKSNKKWIENLGMIKEKINDLICNKNFKIKQDNKEVYFFTIFNVKKNTNLRTSTLLAIYRNDYILNSLDDLIEKNYDFEYKNSEDKIVQFILEVNKYFIKGKNTAREAANRHSVTEIGYITKDKVAKKMIFICLSFLLNSKSNLLNKNIKSKIKKYINSEKNKFSINNEKDVNEIGKKIFYIIIYFYKKYKLEIELFSNSFFYDFYNLLKNNDFDILETLEGDDEDKLNSIKRLANGNYDLS